METRETAFDRLVAKVVETFASVEQLATPGMLKAWVKKSLRKRIDYPTARKLQYHLKRARVGVTLPSKKAEPKDLDYLNKSAGQLRHSASHG